MILNRFLKGSTVACYISNAITPTINTPIDQARPNDNPKPIVESFVDFSISNLNKWQPYNLFNYSIGILVVIFSDATSDGQV